MYNVLEDLCALQIRRGYQYEGEVLYFLDNDGGVMGLLKKKTVWYVNSLLLDNMSP